MRSEGRHRRDVGPLRACDLFGERASPARQHRARRGHEHVTLRGRDAIRADDVHVPQRLVSLLGAHRLARPKQRLQQRLQILDVGRRALVQDDQVDREPLHPPVLVGAQELSHDLHVLELVDLDQHHREIARDPVRPQGVGPARVTCEHLRGRPQHPVRVEDEAAEALKEMRFVGPHAEVMLLHLSLRPRQRRGAVERGGVVILLGQIDGFRARRRDQRRERHARGRARREPDTTPEAHDRIEHRADRVGEGLAIDHRRWRPDPASAAEKSRAIRLPLEITDRFAFDDRHMG